MRRSAQQQSTHLRVNQEDNPRQKTLVIGDIKRWSAEGRNLDTSGDIRFSDLGLLTQAVFEELAPTVVLSPLMADDFDVLDVADKLAAFGYQGRYRAISENLPNVQMIKNEVKAHAPDIDFDILMMPPVANDG